jgi:diguanylate cyclase (GGDEF)-like protein
VGNEPLTDDADLHLPTHPYPLEDEDLEALVEAGREDPTRLSPELQNRGRFIYVDAIWNLTHIQYPADRARELWFEVLDHRKETTLRLGRDVGLRVAGLDYFVNIARELGAPRVIHHDVLTELRHEATRDPLTGLSNRRVYRDALNAEIARSTRYGSTFIVAVFDLDNFKRVNDQLGHSAGDQVLQTVAEILLRAIRKTDLATRWGGEEFVILMPQTGKTGGLEVCERIRRAAENELRETGVTLSGGLAVYPDNGSTERELFGHADRALYRAKRDGKNRISVEPLDRRRFPRVEESFSLRILSVPGNAESKTSDVGEGGLSFSTTSPPPVSSLVEGVIDAEAGRKSFKGRVIYVEESTPGQYEVGVSFTA